METLAGARTFSIDSSHSNLGFMVRHMGFSKVRGSFEDFEGTMEVDTDDLASIEAKVRIKTETISTNDEKRDAHLRSDDFFNTDKYPAITFSNTDVKNVDGKSFTLEGDLTIRDVTKRISLDARFLGEGSDPWGGERIGFEAHTTINRKDFGLNWNAVLESGGILVGEEVKLDLEIEAVQQDDND